MDNCKWCIHSSAVGNNCLRVWRVGELPAVREECLYFVEAETWHEQRIEQRIMDKGW